MTHWYRRADLSPIPLDSGAGLDELGREMADPDRTVARSTVGDAEVSTVFLVIDHQWGNGPPLLWETMIFGGVHNEDQWRYSTLAAARAGHEQVVRHLLAECLADEQCIGPVVSTR